MKNWEKYEEEVKEMNYEFGVIGNEIKRCDATTCKDCTFRHDIKCNPERVKWLYEDYEGPKPKLTKKEWVIVETFSSVDSDHYIARDENGLLYIYAGPPIRAKHNWDGIYSALRLRTKLFPFITWESGKAWSIGELKELKVKE